MRRSRLWSRRGSTTRSPLVRAMAVWALARLAPQRFHALARRARSAEPDPAVQKRMDGRKRREPAVRLRPRLLGAGAGVAPRRQRLADRRHRARRRQDRPARARAATRSSASPARPATTTLPERLRGTTHLLHSIPPGARRRSRAGALSRRDRRAPFAPMDRLSLDGRGLWRPGRRLGRRERAAQAQQRAHRGAGRGRARLARNSARRPASRCRCSGSPAFMDPGGACSTS